MDELFGYTGRDWDSEAKLQYTPERWYDPKLGRFVSSDPIELLAGDPNLYRYVGNHSTTSNDPSGLILIVIDGTAAIGGAQWSGDQPKGPSKSIDEQIPFSEVNKRKRVVRWFARGLFGWFVGSRIQFDSRYIKERSRRIAQRNARMVRSNSQRRKRGERVSIQWLSC